MRISDKEKEIIKRLAKDIFGAQTRVYLFGSRTSDRYKGGDIDLFITSKEKQSLTMRSKLSFLAELKALIGDQKIDVILDTEATQTKSNFYHSIQKHAIEL
jgi:predicted nucleotidyltransferase